MKRLTLDQAQYHVYLPPSSNQLCQRAIGFTLTPLGDGWEQVNYYGDAIFDPSGGIRKPEWVYILVNKDIPGVCKIGMTTTSVEQRTREINSSTGVISPWFPVFRYKCVNAYYLEQDVHQYLQERGYRVSTKREGFYIDSKSAADIIEALGQDYQTYSQTMDRPSSP